jgi:hypothetical protein
LVEQWLRDDPLRAHTKMSAEQLATDAQVSAVQIVDRVLRAFGPNAVPDDGERVVLLSMVSGPEATFCLECMAPAGWHHAISAGHRCATLGQLAEVSNA